MKMSCSIFIVFSLQMDLLKIIVPSCMMATMVMIVVVVVTLVSPSTASKPNIVFIVADDLGERTRQVNHYINYSNGCDFVGDVDCEVMRT